MYLLLLLNVFGNNVLASENVKNIYIKWRKNKYWRAKDIPQNV